MKRRAIFLILIATAAILIAGAAAIMRRSSWSNPKAQAARYIHQHLPSSEWEPTAKFTNPSRTLREGETLARIANLRYGHQHYSDVIKLYNHIENVDAVPVGATLRVPDISTILTEEGFSKVAAPEMEMILCSRAKYDKVVGQLWALTRETPLHERVVAIPQKIRLELLEAADDLQQATESLKTSKPGTIGPPAKMIGQLESAMHGMRQLAEGTIDDNGYDIDMVQQRYALALTYGIIWAREGFE